MIFLPSDLFCPLYLFLPSCVPPYFPILPTFPPFLSTLPSAIFFPTLRLPFHPSLSGEVRLASVQAEKEAKCLLRIYDRLRIFRRAKSVAEGGEDKGSCLLFSRTVTFFFR